MTAHFAVCCVTSHFAVCDSTFCCVSCDSTFCCVMWLHILLCCGTAHFAVYMSYDSTLQFYTWCSKIASSAFCDTSFSWQIPTVAYASHSSFKPIISSSHARYLVCNSLVDACIFTCSILSIYIFIYVCMAILFFHWVLSMFFCHQVVLLNLEVLAEISSSVAGQKYPPQGNESLTLSSPVKKAVEQSHGMNGYFTKFMVSLLKLFSTDRQLLEDRGSFIIRWVPGGGGWGLQTVQGYVFHHLYYSETWRLLW